MRPTDGLLFGALLEFHAAAAAAAAAHCSRHIQLVTFAPSAPRFCNRLLGESSADYVQQGLQASHLRQSDVAMSMFLSTLKILKAFLSLKNGSVINYDDARESTKCLEVCVCVRMLLQFAVCSW